MCVGAAMELRDRRTVAVLVSVGKFTSWAVGIPALNISIPHAHTVCVDPNTHLVYFPLENIDGHPLLRIMEPPNAVNIRVSKIFCGLIFRERRTCLNPDYD